jgi:hypothetical protein
MKNFLMRTQRKKSLSLIFSGLLLLVLLVVATIPITKAETQIPPFFLLSVSPESNSVIQGQSTTYTVTLESTFGFSQVVSLTASELPFDSSSSFSPATVTPTSSGVTSTLTIQTSASTPPTTRTLTITGTAGSLYTFRTVQLTVTPTAATTFSVLVSPASRSVNQGQSATYTVTSTSSGVFSQVVSLTASGLPDGTSSSFSPATVTPTSSGVTSTLTIQTSTSTPVATSTLTITGTAGPTEKIATASLTVSPQAPKLDHFEFDNIGTQNINSVFNVRIIAKDQTNATFAGYSGSGTLSDYSGFVANVTFSNGTCVTPVNLNRAYNDDKMIIDSGSKSSVSETFNAIDNSPNFTIYYIVAGILIPAVVIGGVVVYVKMKKRPIPPP